MKPLVSIIIGHYNRDQALARLLRCLHRQTYPHIEIIVTADGSPPHQPFLWRGKPILLPDLIEEEGWSKVCWVDFGRQESGFPQVAKCTNAGVRLALGEMILLLCNDWWLEDAWVEKMVNSLLPLGRKNHMVGIQKGRRHQVMGDWPYEAHVAPLPLPGFIDSGGSSLLWRDDWIDLDESLDRGSMHQFPVWGHALRHDGQKLWYNSTLIMKHVHPKRRLHQIPDLVGPEEAAAMLRKDAEEYEEICRAIDAGNYKVRRLDE